MDQIINHSVLSLDFWQDTVTYEGSTMPTGTIGCEVLNIPDSTIEELSEHCSITVRSTVIVWLIQALCKFRQSLLVLPQRIAQMPQHLCYSDEHGCLAMLTSQCTNQLLLLRKLQIGFCVLHIFFGKDGCKFLLKIAPIQAGERWCRLQKGDDLASGLLHLRQQLHIHGTGVHPLKQLVQHIAGSIQFFNGIPMWSVESVAALKNI